MASYKTKIRNFQTNLAFLMRMKNITFNQLYHMINVTNKERASYYRLHNLGNTEGVMSSKFDVIVMVADALEVSIDDLLNKDFANAKMVLKYEQDEESEQD